MLRRGAVVRSPPVASLSNDDLAEAMVGAPISKTGEDRAARPASAAKATLSIKDLWVNGDLGLPSVKGLTLDVRGGEIVGVAGVSDNGQKELVEALMGQRPLDGRVEVAGVDFHGNRKQLADLGVYGLPQEPLKNACVGRMSLAENLALRNFDRAPLRRGLLLDRKALIEQADRLVAQFRVKTAGLDARMSSLSGGNVQRAVLARELSHEVKLLIASNPTFGLDFMACEETYRRIVEARNAGTAILLISEDLDELLGVADRVVVMSEGRIVYEVRARHADKRTIGRYMAGSLAA